MHKRSCRPQNFEFPLCPTAISCAHCHYRACDLRSITSAYTPLGRRPSLLLQAHYTQPSNGKSWIRLRNIRPCWASSSLNQVRLWNFLVGILFLLSACIRQCSDYFAHSQKGRLKDSPSTFQAYIWKKLPRAAKKKKRVSLPAAFFSREVSTFVEYTEVGINLFTLKRGLESYMLAVWMREALGVEWIPHSVGKRSWRESYASKVHWDFRLVVGSGAELIVSAPSSQICTRYVSVAEHAKINILNVVLAESFVNSWKKKPIFFKDCQMENLKS